MKYALLAFHYSDGVKEQFNAYFFFPNDTVFVYQQQLN